MKSDMFNTKKIVAARSGFRNRRVGRLILVFDISAQNIDECVEKVVFVLCPGQVICLFASTLGFVVLNLNQTAPLPSHVLTSAPDGTFAR